jgi:hypothetical protein
MGYYQIATLELEMDDRAIIDKYHGLTQIENQFREMKSTLETRPMFVNTPEHMIYRKGDILTLKVTINPF